MSNIRCLLVDDEPYAREALFELLQQEHGFSVVAQAGNAIEAMQALHQQAVDVVFLDIQMPRITGLEWLAMLDTSQMPTIVFVTAYDDYAIQAFEKHAFDYLLKPLDETRLRQTLQRLRQHLQPADYQVLAPASLPHLPGYVGNKLKVVRLQDVEFVYCAPSGVQIQTHGQQIHTDMTLKTISEKTPLLYCHRQYLIAPSAIAEIEVLETGGLITTVSGFQVPVSRRYLKQIKQLFGFH